MLKKKTGRERRRVIPRCWRECSVSEAFFANIGFIKRQKRYAFHWNVDFQSKWSRFEKRFLHSKNRFRKRFVVPENSKKAACKSTNRCQKRFQYVQKPWMNVERIWASAFGSLFSTNNFPRGKHVNSENRCKSVLKKATNNFRKFKSAFGSVYYNVYCACKKFEWHPIRASLSNRCQKRFFKLINTQKRQPENEKMGGGGVSKKGGTLVLVCVAYIWILLPPKHTYSSAPFSSRQ